MKTQFKQYSHTLPQHLLQAREAVMGYIRPTLNAFGLTEQQWRVLRILDELGDQEAGVIAERACILSPSLTGILVRMEKAGLLMRQRDRIDSRRLIISISSHGKSTIKQILPHLQNHCQQIEHSFGHDKMTTLIALLTELEKIPTHHVEHSMPED